MAPERTAMVIAVPLRACPLLGIEAAAQVTVTWLRFGHEDKD